MSTVKPTRQDNEIVIQEVWKMLGNYPALIDSLTLRKVCEIAALNARNWKQ